MATRLLAAERRQLLKIAREAVCARVSGKHLPVVTTDKPALLEQAGCFVTIKQGGNLRGCIGTFSPDKPIWQQVQEMAAAAASKDPRFYPMRASDLDSFSLEISVLSPLTKIDSVGDIIVGTHGLYLEKNFSRGVLLPQVAVEQGWSRDTFLAQTCIKAGLSATDWQEGADIYVFSAQVFAEKQ
jgi:AmmeMemoRadiSam system protein A